MKRAWTKSWLCARALAVDAASAAPAWDERDPLHARRANELTLGGLRPGNDTLAAATRHWVYELYGEPDSTGPSVRGLPELEFLTYTFAWAGTGVPRAMRVFGDRSMGRVLKISLASRNR